MANKVPEWVRTVRFDERGLVPAIVQEAGSGEVLMVAYMNRQALLKTVRTGKTHFYSRSRKKLWFKGESSGHVQRVREVRLDCDGDAVLVRVRQTGGACHTGFRSCFFRVRDARRAGWKESGRRVFDPRRVYGRAS